MNKMLTNKILPDYSLNRCYVFLYQKTNTRGHGNSWMERIYTVSDKTPTVEAVAVTGNKIVFAGAEKEARSLIGDQYYR